VTAEFLDSQNGETTQFKCRSAEPILELGDFVSVKGNEISLVHKPTLIPIRFIVGALIVIPQKTNEPPPPPPRPAVQPFGEWGNLPGSNHDLGGDRSSRPPCHNPRNECRQLSPKIGCR
jgi:hypothetical protein